MPGPLGLHSAADIIPFPVEDMLEENGGHCAKLADWQANVVTDDLLIPRQNPASSAPLASALLDRLR